MNKIVTLSLAVLPVISLAKEPATLTDPKDQVSYAIGVDMARNFKRLRLEFNMDMLIKGLKDATGDKKLMMGEDEIRLIMNAYQVQLQQRAAQITKETATVNRAAGKAFLDVNKSKEGIMTLPSGLQYKIIKEGQGPKPVEDDVVECNYRGTLIDGTEFDSSYPSGKPLAFQLKTVIKGWQEALKLMPTGSKWQLFIPPELAYGERGAGRDIGPNATLIFDLELVSVKNATSDAAAKSPAPADINLPSP